MALALAIGAYALSLAPRGTLGPPWLSMLLAGASLAWVLRAPLDVRRDDFLPPLAVLISALGLATLARLSSALARKQELELLLSLVFVIVAGPAFTSVRRFAAIKYVWLVN